jgi:6-pyruvoyltetrahydropterin/6-carboxytetrahydropterin synthase
MHIVEREHEIHCGHRVAGHEGKCQHLHGHGYVITFGCIADGLDSLGRVIDFGAIKQKLCMWLEDNWDHKFLAWDQDELMRQIAYTMQGCSHEQGLTSSVVWVPFNPTAENMAEYLVRVIGPQQLHGTGVKLVSCKIHETRKCSATFTLEAQ